VVTRPQLSGPIHAEPVDESAELREQIAELREEIESLRTEMRDERRHLTAILQSGRVVFGGPGAVNEAQSASGAPAPPNRGAWDAWKQQLPGRCGKIIDALLVQPMTQTQLVGYCKMDRSTVSKMLTILSRNSLVDKDGNLNRLKRL
jgi:hypothetical protein